MRNTTSSTQSASDRQAAVASDRGMLTACISGLGVAIPEKIMSNADLEKMVDTSDEWITQRTGIRERRVVEPGTPTSDLATKAANAALENAGISAEDVDLLILATFSPDCPYPATACAVQQKIGAKNAAAFDVSAMCSGFIYGLSVGSQFVQTGYARTVLVVGAEVLSSLLDYQDRTTCILFGDGAGAAVLTPDAGEHEIIGTWMGSDGSGFESLWQPAGGSLKPATPETVQAREHFLRMKGRTVFKTAVHKFQEGIKRAAELAGWDLSEIDLVVPHQVNTRIIDAVVQRLGIPEDRIVQNLQRYGNTSAASIPLALHEAVEENRLKPGHKIVFAAVGGGMTWGSAALRW